MPKVLKTKGESIAGLLAKAIYNCAFRRDGDTVFCRVCVKRLASIKKSSLDSHVKTDYHTNMLNRKERHQKQIDGDGYVLSTAANEPMEVLSQASFMTDITNMMIANDIPLTKLNSASFRQLFSKYTKFNPPSEAMARQFILPKLYDKTLESTKEILAGKKIWVSVDETRDRTGRFVGAIVLRSLDALDKPYLVSVVDLEETNSNTICRAVDDAIRMLGSSRDDILMLVTDGARYMIKAGMLIYLISLYSLT